MHHLRELLDTLNDHGATLDVEGDRLVLSGPRRICDDPDIITAISLNRSLLIGDTVGASTGHTLGFCTACGEPSLTHYKPPKAGYPKCRITPHCEGRHEPRAVDVERLTTAGAPERPKQPRPPRKHHNRRLLGPMPTWPDAEDV
jgi:hypothetical protein